MKQKSPFGMIGPWIGFGFVYIILVLIFGFRISPGGSGSNFETQMILWPFLLLKTTSLSGAIQMMLFPVGGFLTGWFIQSKVKR